MACLFPPKIKEALLYMDFFPVFLRLSDRQVLVVGGGDVACRKVDLLLRANANITVVSPELHAYLCTYVEEGKITYLKKCYEQNDLTGFDQIWATTNHRELNHRIYKEATERGLWVNVVDDPQYCHFITPSIVDRSPIQVAISSGGASPVLIRYLRERFETFLPQNLSVLADFAGKQRERIKQHFSTVDERRKFWERYFRSPVVENATKPEELESVFQQLLNEPDKVEQSIVYIQVGSDPELLTLKALRLMQQAEYIVYCDTCPEIFVDLCRRDADREKMNHEKLIFRAEELAKKNIRVVILSPVKLSDSREKVVLLPSLDITIT